MKPATNCLRAVPRIMVQETTSHCIWITHSGASREGALNGFEKPVLRSRGYVP
jgi:hypothetical protein